MNSIHAKLFPPDAFHWSSFAGVEVAWSTLREPTEGPLLLPWNHRGLFQITGPGAGKFLQGHCTQDVADLNPGEGAYGFILKPKGSVVGDVHILRLEDGFLLESGAPLISPLLAHLKPYALLAEVDLCDNGADHAGFLLLGEEWSAMLEEASDGRWPGVADQGVLLEGGGYLVADDESGTPACRLWIPKDRATTVVSDLLEQETPQGSPVVLDGLGPWNRLRVLNYRPWFQVDYDATTLPAESGQMVRGVSLTKGCYCGQEVVAKQHYLGRTRKSLVGLCGEAGQEIPIGSTVLDCDAQARGVVTSVAAPDDQEGAWMALATLRGSPAIGDQYQMMAEGVDLGSIRVIRTPRDAAETS